MSVPEPVDGTQGTRPRDPWVFAGALDDRPRTLFVALHHDLWLAFDTARGTVYKAWRGGLQPASLNPDRFSAWPAAINGLLYQAGADENPWRLIRNGRETTPEVIYRGYRIAGDRLTITYQLVSAQGQRIDIEETPEVIHDAAQRPGLTRSFFVAQAPPNVQVALDVNAQTLKSRTDLQTNGVFQRSGEKTHTFVWGKTFDIAGRLLLNTGSVTDFTTYFAPNLLKNLEDETALDPLELFKNTRVYQSLDLGDEASASNRMIRRQGQVPGVSVKVYGIGESIDSLMQLAPGQLPTANSIQPALDLTSKQHFGDLDFYFISHINGNLNVVSEGIYSFQVLADDGVRFSIGDSLLYEHNGLQAAEPSADIDIYLKPGLYPLSVEHFQSTGQKRLTIKWRPPWSGTFDVLEAPTLSTRKEEQRRVSVGKKHVLRQFPDALIDLERIAVDAVHPGLTVSALKNPALNGAIGGIDVLSDGRLVLATWDGTHGNVWLVDDNPEQDKQLQARVIAKGLAYPFGIKAVDDEVFLLQRHELTQLIDLDGDEEIDEYRVVANDWPLTNDFDEYAFGLSYHQGSFYAGLAAPVDGEGAILIEDLPDRGNLVRLGFDGSVVQISDGFQVNNGVWLDDEGTLAVMDHRNPWFSDSRLMLVSGGQGRSFLPAAANKAAPLAMSSIWLPSGSESKAPTQPVRMKAGPYAGQWVYGDLQAGRLNRVYVETVEDQLQGAVFRYTGGLPFPVNRLVVDDEGALLAGGLTFAEPWLTLKPQEEVLQRITFSGEEAFEMVAMHAMPDGFELAFSAEVSETAAEDVEHYRVYTWSNHESAKRRRPDRSLVDAVPVQAVQISDDGKRVRLSIDNMKAGAIYYINLAPAYESASGDGLWSNEAWYSLNVIPGSAIGQADD
ncbi:MAG: PA14 domain-containing protein [Bacteroidota bacterium]